MATFFCTACWTAVPETAARCPACGADLRALDVESFDRKLVRALQSPDASTVRRAVEVLGRRAPPHAASALLRRYRAGADPYLAAEIARALGRIGTGEAAKALRVLADDRSVIVRRAVYEAHAMLSRQDANA
ncbi:MAG: HEAT repeat domain-containing protein [Gemmatimonadota bacterium]|jgi:HEAT repeat protein